MTAHLVLMMNGAIASKKGRSWLRPLKFAERKIRVQATHRLR
jgi:hypothetical protein